jgi:N,N'-diacetyllegionaminate synthase
MRTQIIAEVTSNHGGDLALAREFIRHAADAGADFVKFQSWRASTVRDGAADPQFEWFVKSELSDADHRTLIDECGQRGIGFLTTCFDIGRVEFLASLGLQAIKVGSPDLTSRRMLEALRAAFPRVIVSTGVGTDDEVEQAAGWLAGGDFSLLHCVSLYPMPPARAHLRRMNWLRRFTPSVGWSDHTEGNEVAKLAIASGADIVEKHFCLGRSGPGRAMPWDATPDDLAELVAFAAEVENVMGSETAPAGSDLAAAKARFVGRWGDNQ